jgi:hypothetical protein
MERELKICMNFGFKEKLEPDEFSVLSSDLSEPSAYGSHLFRGKRCYAKGRCDFLVTEGKISMTDLQAMRACEKYI